jgi:PAS domain-containing protein
VVNRPLHELPVGPRDGEDAERITQTVWQTGNWQGEFRARRKDGTELLAYALHAAIENERGQPVGFVGVSFDPSREPSEP